MEIFVVFKKMFFLTNLCPIYSLFSDFFKQFIFYFLSIILYKTNLWIHVLNAEWR